jgi:uncharacterized protein
MEARTLRRRLFALGAGFLIAIAGFLTTRSGTLRAPLPDSIGAGLERRYSQSVPMAQASPLQEKSRNTNHLIHEKSPYLLMHAHNPVDWYPWGEEAFEKARREQKPIFLSVGYSTCHWCHVMERESFSDPAIAEILNRHFVSIKVDREERPDVDGIYMTYVQATTGSGGWPMSVFLTPDLKPFFGGTYFPPDDRFGHPGFRTVLMRVAEAWQNDGERIRQSADHVTQELGRMVSAGAGGGTTPQQSALDEAYRQIKASYDPTYGGFGDAPKFPRPVVLNFLLRYYARTGEQDALQMTLHTLRAMAAGGMHDALGGGFHRYSTDAAWHVPHFEKMLYDQAQLAISYVEAFQITHDAFFAETARDILEYVLRELRAPEGGFYSAEDADSLIEPGKPEHGEGAFYVWEAAQIEEVLGPDAAAVFDFYYGVESSGNVAAASDPHGEFGRKNILIVRHSLTETARHFGRTESEVTATLKAAREKLFAVQARRPRPSLDDKVLTAWNGLMISTFARASQALDEPRFLAAAEGAATFVKSRLFDAATGRLQRRYRAGEAAIDGFVDDYAFLVQGLLDLYEASFDVTWLSWAMQLQSQQDDLFWDPQQGGYFSTSGRDASILLRMRDAYDGAEPSPNSVAALNLLRISQMTDRQEWKNKAETIFRVFARRLEASPEAVPQLAVALDFSLSKPKQIIIAGNPQAADTRALLRLVHERFIPNKILLLADGGQAQKQLAQWLPFLQGVVPLKGQATAYICENYVCKLPTSDPQEVARLLSAKS